MEANTYAVSHRKVISIKRTLRTSASGAFTWIMKLDGLTSMQLSIRNYGSSTPQRELGYIPLLAHITGKKRKNFRVSWRFTGYKKSCWENTGCAPGFMELYKCFLILILLFSCKNRKQWAEYSISESGPSHTNWVGSKQRFCYIVA